MDVTHLTMQQKLHPSEEGRGVLTNNTLRGRRRPYYPSKLLQAEGVVAELEYEPGGKAKAAPVRRG